MPPDPTSSARQVQPDRGFGQVTRSQAAPTTLVPPSGPDSALPQPTFIRLNLRNRGDSEEATPAAEAPSTPPAVTDAPAIEGQGIDANGDAIKFVQTTYYSCVTMGTYSHCGWHEPILDASSGTKSAFGRDAGIAMRAASAAAIVGAILLGR
ncbi:hypothetical protein QBC46DRAFT_70237 [Diplogelasinospora grovesii]|uniref:Uncharacterized protein n=1 Tax=Diplogelasinospora grovesii TaxID=303347 RepID=A0AAN6MYV1_9PEZI|nr:hypothetical protein QBC46DRAFT_70237 [Diplogelasinospora grovesii]